ncbi:MAG TPA: hypothetical protein VMV69_18140 [Pirellulales bacterium]|nr:hypothetical protein [Pirellulales bacterium]
MATPLAAIVTVLKPKRRWAQFSLGTMFLVVTALCVWLGLHVEAVNRQRAVVAAIRALGGECYYDYEADGNPFADSVPPGPEWLRECLGIDHLASITAVHLYKRAQIPRALPHLCKLPKLAALSVDLKGQPAFTDDDVAQIKALTGLARFYIAAATETDSLLAAVASLPHLETLHMYECALGDNGLRHIGRMKSLRVLRLTRNEITDAGLIHVRALTELRKLDLTMKP